jgi:hypothetical protein
VLGLVFILMVARNRPMGATFYGFVADEAFTRFMSAPALVGSLVTPLLLVELMRQKRFGDSNIRSFSCWRRSAYRC